METLTKTRFHWQRPVLLALIALAVLAVAIFGLRTYRSFLLLHSAYELVAPDVSSVRPWMTLGYVARAYHLPATALAERLGLTPDTDLTTTLIALAQKQGLSPFGYLRQVQEAIPELRPNTSPPGASDAASGPDGFGDDILAALLVYGYPVLGLTLMLGAFGLPLAILGRLIWSSAYLSLGYGFGVAIEAAADFTSSIGGLLVSLLILAGVAFMLYRNHPSHSVAKH